MGSLIRIQVWNIPLVALITTAACSGSEPSPKPHDDAVAVVPAPTPSPPPTPTPAPTPQPPPQPARTVPSTQLARVAGDVNISPDDPTKLAIENAGKSRTVATLKLCIGTAGDITDVTTLKSSGFKTYDDKLATTVRSTWRYAPLVVDGTPVPACSAVTFVYTQT